MSLLDHPVKIRRSEGGHWEAPTALSTSFPAKTGEARAIPNMLLVPLYHKMRISWEWALGQVTEINAFLTQLTQVERALNLDTLEWDVYVTTLNEIRTELRNGSSLPPDRKVAALTLPMPRFIWRATAYRKEHAIFDLFFDATDVEAGDPLVQVQVYDAFALAFLQELSKDLTKLPFNKRVRQFVAKFSS